MNNCPTCGAPKPNDDWDWSKEYAYRLFAAAPCLLAACQLLAALEDANVHPADTRWKQAAKDMRAAISRAEGKG